MDQTLRKKGNEIYDAITGYITITILYYANNKSDIGNNTNLPSVPYTIARCINIELKNGTFYYSTSDVYLHEVYFMYIRVLQNS